MSFAEIQRVNGQPTIVIDGRPYPPMAMTARIKKPDYLEALGKAGIKIYFLMTNTRWLRPGRDWVDENGVSHHEPSGMEKFKADAELLLKCVPDAYIIVRIGLHPPVDWVESHPDDMMQYQDGSHQPAILMSEVHKDVLPGMYSLCSDAWREDGRKALEEFCDEVDTLPFADRIIGYFLAAGGTSEWYPVNPLEDWKNDRRSTPGSSGTSTAPRKPSGAPGTTRTPPSTPLLSLRWRTGNSSTWTAPSWTPS